jgi:hypothetical protein
VLRMLIVRAEEQTADALSAGAVQALTSIFSCEFGRIVCAAA